MDSCQCFFPSLHVEHAPIVGGVRYEECPERVARIQEGLRRLGTEASHDISPLVAIDELRLVHDLDYLQFLQSSPSFLQELGCGGYVQAEVFAIRSRTKGNHNAFFRDLAQYAHDSSAPLGVGTWTAACNSAQAALEAAECIASEKDVFAYACCRPPGHHAGRDYMGGFCYLNNAALAAEKLRTLGRVAVIDVDYHHGNGTQDIFYRDPDVFFLSLHGDPRTDYPYVSGFEDERGEGDGKGTTLNLPLPPGTTGTQYLHALRQGLDHIRAFQPHALVISLGFDTFRADPLTQWLLDLKDISSIARELRSLDLPTVVVQEGGYALEALSELSESFFGSLLSDRS